MNHFEFRDILPRIASVLGIVSATALLITCKSTAALLTDDDFWKSMIRCRFGAPDETVAKIRHPKLIYIRMYYADFVRCNEIASNYRMFCSESISCYYQGTGLARPHQLESPKPDEYMSIVQTPLYWALWYGSEEVLINVLEAIRPEEREWALGTSNWLAIPADRREIVKRAIIKHTGIKEDWVGELLGDVLMDSEVRIRGFVTVMSMFADLGLQIDIWNQENFPGIWLAALEIQDRAEKVGMWVNCQPPSRETLLWFDRDVNVVHAFISMYDRN